MNRRTFVRSVLAALASFSLVPRAIAKPVAAKPFKRLVTIGPPDADFPGFTSAVANRALSYIRQGGGGVVMSLPGEYACSETIEVRGRDVVFLGSQASFVAQPDFNGPVFLLEGDGIGLHNVTVVGSAYSKVCGFAYPPQGFGLRL